MRTIKGRYQEKQDLITKPTYNFKEGDRVLVCFEEYLNQPGISKFQDNTHSERTDFTTAQAWKKGTIDMIGMNGETLMAHVILDGHYKKYTKGWVFFDRLQPYIERNMT
jgi:hypothetical protein